MNADIGALGTGFDARFTTLENRFENLEAKIDALTARVTDLNNRFARIESKLDAR